MSFFMTATGISSSLPMTSINLVQSDNLWIALPLVTNFKAANSLAAAADKFHENKQKNLKS